MVDPREALPEVTFCSDSDGFIGVIGEDKNGICTALVALLYCSHSFSRRCHEQARVWCAFDMSIKLCQCGKFPHIFSFGYKKS